MQTNQGLARCTIQVGATAPPKIAAHVGYTGHDEMEELFEAADVVVCHGGPGAIAAARRFGRLPIVVPRDPAFGEHIDGHQVAFARRLAEQGDVLLATDRGAFHRLLSQAIDDQARVRLDEGQQVAAEAAVRRFAEIVDPLLERGRARRGRSTA